MLTKGRKATSFLGISFLLMGVLAGCAGGMPSSLLSSSKPPTPSNPPNPPAPTQPAPTPTQSGSVTISPQNAAAAPSQTVHFTAVVTGGGALTWSVNGVAGGNSTVGTIDTNGNYTAPATVSQSENVVVQAALTSAPQANSASAVVAVIQAGVVANTANPLVAEYSIYLPQPGSMSVQFGPDTSYGLNTWSQSTPTVPTNNGGEINMEVAGMRGSSTYHMQALITLANGVTFQDTDHTFATGAAPPTVPVTITTPPSGQTPQPGVELFDSITFGSKPIANLAQAFVTDLHGNVIWTYSYQGSAANAIFPIKQLSDGNFLVVIGYVAGPTAKQNIPAGTLTEVREVDLAGNTIHSLSIAQLNQSLAADGFTGLNLLTFCTDALQLPNGHLLLLAWMTKPYTNLPGYPGTINVLGTVIVDVDQNYNPTWVWNPFQQLGTPAPPYSYQFPDWTHSNALLYSPDDHNLLLSIRQQNRIVKIDYNDGAGTGNVIWSLGEGRDFKLVGATDPTDWFYAQHGMNFFSPSTSGVFDLGVMDNGNDRLLPSGQTCGTTGAPACYSTAMVLRVDEAAKTATMLFHYNPSPSIYSYFGGQTDQLQNNDVEVDFCAAKGGATVFELSPTGTATQPIWQAHTPGYNQYRVVRLPSLYPGVQW
ncbi:MAG TPA: aryl-sulfate sulfotransferase [Acidobacteriaceae bacterium]|nr:aryl-sulfate sulfotransferase [Terriglobia bacterium]HVC90013.1 aryl-sulfate sulfotransferase [Acidobacteriaceae bacterium]